MPTSAHIKKGDEVVVLTGKERGKSGKVLEILKKKERAIVEGLMMIKRHEKKTEERPEGAIVEREGSIHISNLMTSERFEARKAKKA